MENYIKIKNIGQTHQPLNFFVVGLSGQDTPVTLSLGEFLYTPKQDTRNLIIYSRKNILSIEDVSLPDRIELYRVYSDATMPTYESEAVEQEPFVEQIHETHEVVEQTVEILPEHPIIIEPLINPVVEQIAELPAEKKETKKRKRIYKKKLGRPKKRGPKPKKKPIGRPKKNK